MKFFELRVRKSFAMHYRQQICPIYLKLSKKDSKSTFAYIWLEY